MRVHDRNRKGKAMKARLYRATGEARNYVDGYSLYLPYPE